MSEVGCLELSILLWFAHILAQAAFAGGALGLDYLSGPRDEKREPHGVLYPRATRALRNYVENLGPFVAADLGLIVTSHAGGWGASLWILCRIVYLPLYIAGVSPWRTAAWALSLVGLLMMLWRLF
jgi:uncharacterized MAPEG superfamily protein